jgi:enoyl-CoA hydratase/carnithine racemase
MKDLSVDRRGDIAVLSLRRGKVNALDPSLVEDLRRELSRLADDDSVGAMILTGSGSFFSFGFDIPEFLSYSKAEFGAFLTEFTDLYTELFLFPKPAIAALNGHAIAGGCMLALACDQRLMAGDRGKISLNEITFGSSVFAGSVEMLVSCVGQRNAAEVLYSGAMLTADEACRLGLVDRVSDSEELLEESRGVARQLAAADRVAFSSMKKLLREPIAERMRQHEEPSIREFIDIWYSESTRRRLREIKIR